jgi:hypothetical protein
MTNAEACRVAPRLRQYLASGVGFWCRMGTAPPPVLAENAQCLCSSLAPLCPRCWVPIVALCVVAPGGLISGETLRTYPAQHACNSPPDRWRDGPSVCDIIINAYRTRFWRQMSTHCCFRHFAPILRCSNAAGVARVPKLGQPPQTLVAARAHLDQSPAQLLEPLPVQIWCSKFEDKDGDVERGGGDLGCPITNDPFKKRSFQRL